MKTAFITGVAGQDGSYLAEHLLSLGYRVTGIVRRNSTVEHQRNRVSHLPLELEYGDMTDQSSLERALRMFKPDEIYNLAAQSHVRISSDIPQFTAQTNSIGVLNILEAYKSICPEARFYQASSSEMFGSSVDPDQYQRETTPMRPVSPYGCSKVFAYNIVHHYRDAYKLHASNGILFNHESPRRGSNFVTNKVVKGAVEIALGLATQLELGNMDSYRDWGHSADYVKAMHLIAQQDRPDDYVVATGETRSVREMCDYVFGRLNLNYQDYVVQNKKYLRPEELPYLRGDSTKIRTQLGWQPEYTFEALMDEMIEHWQHIYSRQIKETQYVWD
jgi:GDPmannose 4,6-dehydratase